MSASIYQEKYVEPNDKMLSVDLAETIEYYNKICSFLQEKYGDVRPEWNFTTKHRAGF